MVLERGYGVAQQGNTGCGIKTAHIATRHQAMDAHLDFQGAEVDTKMDVELHSSLNSVLINKSNTSKKILNILLLGNKEAIRGERNLNLKEVATLNMEQFGIS